MFETCLLCNENDFRLNAPMKTSYWNIEANRPPILDDLEERILYEQDGVIVVDKPGGIQTSGKSLDDSSCLQFWMMKRARRMVWAVHQLDADTSGVNIFVRKKSLVPEYQKRMTYPNAEKSYLALVHGSPEWRKKVVSAPIGKLSPKQLGVCKNGKAASTEFRVLNKTNEHAWIRATLRSGRTHQIRIHLQHVGLKLIGEPWYGEPCEMHWRHTLHATEIVFRDGVEPQRFLCDLPKDLVDLSKDLGLSQSDV